MPVHVEESHAGAFYHLVETAPLREAHTLVLIDAHSDANGMADSDQIRSAIRKGPTLTQRAALLDEWRQSGKIQCYNWIEPLMPAPIAEVIWIPAARLSVEERTAMETGAREYLDAHQETQPRAAGALGPRYRVLSLENFAHEAASWPETKPVVASIDLDFFAKTDDAGLKSQMEGMMDVLLHMRALRSLSFAISSPYLRDAAQAGRLVTLALDVAWRIPNARVHFDPFATTGPDRSLMARLMERQGKRPPVFDVTQAGTELRSLLLQHWRHPRAEALLAEWRRAPFQYRISLAGRLKTPNGAWELEFDPDATLEVVPHPTGSRVCWWALRAEGPRYRIGDANAGFAADAPRWIWQKSRLLAEGPVLSCLKLADLTGGADCGTFEVYAEVIRDGEITRTPKEIVRLSKPGTRGLHAEWSRQFGLPYVFDSRLLRRGSLTGAEACHGADCANFITAGLRAEGWLLPWGSPTDVRPFLKRVQGLEDPALLHFGSHLAAVWEDLPPVGQLDDSDLCVHQLEGTPEILPYAKLRQNRPPPELMTICDPTEVIRIAICGDLMLGRTMTEHPDALAEASPVLRRADLALGNLECVIGTAEAKHRLQLIAPPQAAKLLSKAGLDGLSVANNHAMDLGPEGAAATQAALREAHIVPISATPHVFEVKGKRIAVLALDDSVEDEVVPRLDIAADYVIALPHWGTEHRTSPSMRQRELAVRLMQAGVHLVAGSGPHALQPLEHLPGGSVAFSLGNTVFDGPGPDVEWDRGAVLEVTLEATTCRPVRMRMIEVRADARPKAAAK
ncbi:MAG: CapA family protein [Prosthecobacter sp.]